MKFQYAANMSYVLLRSFREKNKIVQVSQPKLLFCWFQHEVQLLFWVLSGKCLFLKGCGKFAWSVMQGNHIVVLVTIFDFNPPVSAASVQSREHRRVSHIADAFVIARIDLEVANCGHVQLFVVYAKLEWSVFIRCKSNLRRLPEDCRLNDIFYKHSVNFDSRKLLSCWTDAVTSRLIWRNFFAFHINAFLCNTNISQVPVPHQLKHH